MTALDKARQGVAEAKERLYKTVRETYPVGCECIYKKRDRGPGVVVEVSSWANEGRLYVINRETGNRYLLNGESDNIRRKPVA